MLHSTQVCLVVTMILLNNNDFLDAKVLMPSAVFQKAREGNSSVCTDICTLLCNEADGNSIKLV
jgi:hypothetical protein